MPARLLLTLLVLFQVAPSGDGAKHGRRGNANYEREQYQEAAAAFREGLAALPEEAAAGPVRSGLWNNLGAALYRTQDYEGARDAFHQALALASTDADRARAAYNAGNTALALQQMEAALVSYKQALLIDPRNEDAKFNYEYVKRQLQQQQSQQNQQQNIEPSDYAKQLKAQAEALVAQRQYRPAFDLMMEGLKVDSTVQAFQTFITRTKDVADIDDLAP